MKKRWKKITSCLVCTVLVAGVLHPVSSASETVAPDTVIVEEIPTEVYTASEQPMSAQAERTVPDQTDADLPASEDGTREGDSADAAQMGELLLGNGAQLDSNQTGDIQLDAFQTEEWVFGESDSDEQGFLASESDPSGNPAQFAETESLENLAGPLMPIVDAPAMVSDSGVSDNRNKQDYSIYSSPMYSYLVMEGEDYLRVESCDGQILIERYNQEFLLQSQMTLGYELPLFGGFYAGSDAYYLVFGQTNPEESDAVEVVRVVKYDKNWARLGSASLFGANTVIPFDAGSLRMTEYGGYLYIRTSHEMYQSSDGLNHQANLMMQVRTSDMAVTDSYYEVWNLSSGYVSHSFNQFILADDAGNLVALDHGDAYPRSFVLIKYGKKAGEPSFSGYYGNENVSLMNFRGEDGENATGASVGGLEYSTSSYLTAGNSVRQDENWSSNRVRNIFVATTSRNDFTSNGSRLKWITDYQEGSRISATTPQLVKLSPDRFLLLWGETQAAFWWGDTPLGNEKKLCYLFLDGNANPLSDIYMADGYLSDCEPIEKNGGAIWYATDGEKLTFYRVNADGTFQKETAHLHDYEPEMTFAEETLECGLIEGTASNPLTTNSDGEITYSSDNPGIAQVGADGTVTLKGIGTCTITAFAAAGQNYRAKSASYTLVVRDLKQQTIQVSEIIIKTWGDADFSLGASCLGGAPLRYASSDEKVAVVSADGTVSIRGIGTAIITVQAEKFGDYIGAQTEVTLTVQESPSDAQGQTESGTSKRSLSKCKVKLQKSKYAYTGKAIKPTITVTYGKTTLKKNKDYKVSYKNNKKIGKATVTITGKGKYHGTVKKTFQIVKKAQKWKVTVSQKNIQKGKTATIRVKKAVGKVTYKSSNPKIATVSASGKIKALSSGKATITVTAKGNKHTKSATRKIQITVKKG